MNPMIEETIERVEQLYTTLTGTRPPAPNGHRTAFPPEIDPVVHVQEQLGRLVVTLERVLPLSTTATWVPRASVWNHEGDPVFAIDIPGVTREQVYVRVDPTSFTVVGRRQPPVRTLAACDASFGPFARTFELGRRVTPEQVSAHLHEDGVLTIRVHSSTKAQPSNISIMS
jgi:HSP20 family molecular chaperone IbpA